MKNKKWKRKAKRLYGECFKTSACPLCKYEEKCLKKPSSLVPVVDGIRATEKAIKKFNIANSKGFYKSEVEQ